jgi:hypothetical protein
MNLPAWDLACEQGSQVFFVRVRQARKMISLYADNRQSSVNQGATGFASAR